MHSLCKICHQKEAEYTCPRCNTRYCSLQCYKKHDARCTESFYRSNAESELIGRTATEEEKRRMEEVLVRLHKSELEEGEAETSSSDEEADPLQFMSAETLARLQHQEQSGEASGEAAISLEDLTLEEQEAFKKLVESGKLSHLVAPWEPWWLSNEASNLLLRPDGTAPVIALDDKGEAGGALPLPPAEPLPKLTSLTKVEPSPLLRWQILDVLYSYCLAMRIHNGDCLSESQDATALVIDVSPALEAAVSVADGQRGPPLSGAALIQELQRRALRPSALGNDSGASTMAGATFQDVAAILGFGRPGVVCALSDLQKLAATGLEAGLEAVKNSEKKGREGKESRRKGFLIGHKLLFLLVWANEQAKDMWEGLQAEVQVLAPDLSRQGVQSGLLIEGEGVSGARRHMQEADRVKAGRTLITEL